MRARVPAAGISAELGFVEPLRERPLGLRVLALVLRTRLVAVSLTVKCPLLFMTCFLSSFQATTRPRSNGESAQLALVKMFSCGSRGSTASRL